MIERDNVTCIKDCVINGLKFHKGIEYKVRYNTINGQIYIYSPWGFTYISKEKINQCFL